MTRPKALFWLYMLGIHAVALVAAVCLYQGRAAGPAAPDASKAHYDRMLTYHLRLDASVPEGTTVFVGDSTIQSLYASAVTLRAVNFGVGSDTTAGVAKRIGRYTCIPNAATVILAIGIVDLLIGRETEGILADYRMILDAIPSNVDVIMVAVLPTDERVGGKRVNDRIGRLNQWLRVEAGARSQCTFVDLSGALADPTGNLSADYHVGDGIHLNSRGYAIMIEGLRKALGTGP